MAVEVRCPNCGYQGPGKVQSTAGGCLVSLLLMGLGAVAVVSLGAAVECAAAGGLLVLAGFVIGAVYGIGSKRMCPRCGWKHVVRLDGRANT